MFGFLVKLVLFFVVLPMFLLGFLGQGLLGIAGDVGLQEVHHSLNPKAKDKVAIITISGLILEAEGGYVKKQIDAVRNDPDVKAVVLRVDSPGGTITASDYLYHHLKELTDDRGLPLVVSMGGLCASGGYYVSMVVGDRPDSILAEPTTWTGSIGVIIPHYDVSGLMQKWDIREDSVASHELKGMGSPTRTMTDQERGIFQDLVNDAFDRFKEIVRSGRHEFRGDKGSSELDKIATGQVFTAKQAVKSGLVDRIGFIEDEVDRAVELASLKSSRVNVVKYRKPVTLVDAVLGASSQAKGFQLSQFLDLSAPRAYFLCTKLPISLGNN